MCEGPNNFAGRAFTVDESMSYFLQQLPVQPSLQQVCLQLSLQQSLQLVFFAKDEVCANVATPRTAARERYARVRFIVSATAGKNSASSTFGPMCDEHANSSAIGGPTNNAITSMAAICTNRFIPYYLVY